MAKRKKDPDEQAITDYLLAGMMYRVALAQGENPTYPTPPPPDVFERGLIKIVGEDYYRRKLRNRTNLRPLLPPDPGAG